MDDTDSLGVVTETGSPCSEQAGRISKAPSASPSRLIAGLFTRTVLASSRSVHAEIDRKYLQLRWSISKSVGSSTSRKSAALSAHLAWPTCPDSCQPFRAGDKLRKPTVAAVHRSSIIDQTDRPISYTIARFTTAYDSAAPTDHIR